MRALRALRQREMFDGIVVTQVRLPARGDSERVAGGDPKGDHPTDSVDPGQILCVRSPADYARPRCTKLLVDGARGFGHMNADIQRLDRDFYAASSHHCAAGHVGPASSTREQSMSLPFPRSTVISP